MRFYLSHFLIVSAMLLATVFNVYARTPTSVKHATVRAENSNMEKSKLIIPYGFSSESMGVTLGVGGLKKGYLQDQLLIGATAFASFDSAVALYLGMWDYKLPWSDRLYFSAQGMVGHYPRQRAYTSPEFEPNQVRQGSNASDEKDYYTKSGYDNWSDLKLEYVLPIGQARHASEVTYKLKDGLLQSPVKSNTSWNPLNNGTSILLFRQYNRFRSFETDYGELEATTHPVQLALSYDNTDYSVNPSSGSSQFIAVTHDFGWLESPDDWTFIEFEASKYFSFGASDYARQRILALNVWTGDAPTWEETTNEKGNIKITHRPPFYEGASLGGFYRMRAYPQDRFNDRSVLYTTAEYRYTLDWNPIAKVSWLKFLQCDWVQLVGFFEGGRVANEYSLSELFQDWKLDAGLGFRTMFAGGIARIDFAASEEGSAMWIMFGHPF